MIPILRPEGAPADAPQTAIATEAEGAETPAFGLVFAAGAAKDEQVLPKGQLDITTLLAAEDPAEDQPEQLPLVEAEEAAPAIAPAEAMRIDPTVSKEVEAGKGRTDQNPKLDTKPAVTAEKRQNAPEAAKTASPQVSVAQTVVEGRLPVDRQLAPIPPAETAAKVVQGPPQPPQQAAIAVAQKASANPLLPTAKAGAHSAKDGDAPVPMPTGDVLAKASPPAAQVSTDARSIVLPANAVLAQLAAAAKPELSERSTPAPDIEIGLAPVVGDRPSAGIQATAAVTPPSGSQMAHHAATQIAQAMAGSAAGPTEISLNPEELGRVRLSMTAGDGAITLTIAAERPETTDLLRRNIDALAQEFRELGYDNLSFSFGATSDGEAGADEAADETMAEPTSETADAPLSTRADVTGLDLRL